MKILIVDDNIEKTRDVINVLIESGVPGEQNIDHATNAFDAAKHLKKTQYDLLILDLFIPQNKASEPLIDGGKNLLKDIMRRQQYNLPSQIVGLTSFDEAIEDSHADFDNGLWSIIRYCPSGGNWKSKISDKVRYLSAKANAIECNLEFNYDAAFVCALREPELSELIALPDLSWTKVENKTDPTEYWECAICDTAGNQRKILACFASQMGMAAAAALTTKVCIQYRPKFIIMSGICAGREGDVCLGDVVAANPSWDYGSGKFTNVDKLQFFAAHPTQLQLSPMIRKSMEQIAQDQELLDKIKRNFSGTPPSSSLGFKISPMASGSAVRADDGFFDELAGANRKVIAVDMEAYGVFLAATEMIQPIPEVAVIKGVSDFANSDKDDSARQYAAYASAACSIELLKKYWET